MIGTVGRSRAVSNAVVPEWVKQQIALQKELKETIENMGMDTATDMSYAFADSIDLAVAGEMNLGEAMRRNTEKVLRSLGRQATAKAIMALGEGVYGIAIHDPVKAAAGFKAAGIFGLMGALSFGGAAAVAVDDSEQGERPSSLRDSTEGADVGSI